MVLDFIEILKVIFLGIVEGITEWLPISSTGHMILVDEFITLNMSEAPIVQSQWKKALHTASCEVSELELFRILAGT